VGQRSPLYIAMWRWHFYAGLYVIPFASLLAITGGLYLFRPQIEASIYRRLLYVQSAHGTRLSPDEIVANVRRNPVWKKVVSYVPPMATNESARVGVMEHGKVIDVFVNPYSGQILGEQNPSTRIMQRVRNLHGKLLAGKYGQFFVETAGGWAFVLLVTGVFLWFPRRPFSVWGTLLPRFHTNKRTFLRDLHCVPAVYLALAICFLVSSGMPWSLVSGAIIKDLASHTPKPTAPGRTAPNIPVPDSTSPQQWLAELPQMSAAQFQSTPTGKKPLSIAALMEIAQRDGVHDRYQLLLPTAKTGVYVIRALPADLRDTAFIYVDQYSGATAGDIRWRDLSPMAKAVTFGTATHEGREFGVMNQVVGLIVCLGVLGTCISGTILWWQRRPSGRIGSPRLVRSFQAPRGIVISSIVLSILFPLVGFSLLLALCFDRYLLPKLPRLARVLN